MLHQPHRLHQSDTPGVQRRDVFLRGSLCAVPSPVMCTPTAHSAGDQCVEEACRAADGCAGCSHADHTLRGLDNACSMRQLCAGAHRPDGLLAPANVPPGGWADAWTIQNCMGAYGAKAMEGAMHAALGEALGPGSKATAIDFYWMIGSSVAAFWRALDVYGGFTSVFSSVDAAQARFAAGVEHAITESLRATCGLSKRRRIRDCPKHTVDPFLRAFLMHGAAAEVLFARGGADRMVARYGAWVVDALRAVVAEVPTKGWRLTPQAIGAAAGPPVHASFPPAVVADVAARELHDMEMALGGENEPGERAPCPGGSRLPLDELFGGDVLQALLQ